MVTWLFIIGVLTALGCGWNVMVNPATWKSDAVWTFGGLCGAGLMVLAIYLRKWGY